MSSGPFHGPVLSRGGRGFTLSVAPLAPASAQVVLHLTLPSAF